MAASLGRIFNTGLVNDIEVLYDEVKNSGIIDPVGTSAFQLRDESIDASKPNLKVFDLSANLGADASAKVSIAAAGTPIAPFDPATPLTPPAGSSYANLHVDGKLSAGAAGTLPSVPLDLSATGSAELQYDHYLPVAATERRAEALARLVATAQLPQFESLTTMQPGEISKLQTTLNVDVGVKAKFGGTFDLDHTVKLFDGLSAQFTANARYSLEASLGWSLFDEMQLVVGRGQTLHDEWVRIRIDRQRKNQLTAGATFALQVAYDASSLATALEKAFEMTPLPRAIDVLRTVSTMTWDQVKAAVTERAANELISLIAGTGWKEKAASSPEVAEVLASIDKVVATYDSVDAKVQQLWSTLLVRADLQPGSALRTTLDKIAALDPNKPDLTPFLSATAQKDLAMLESLTGRSLEELLVGSSAAVQLSIARAVSLAKQLERVVNETPSKVTSAFQQFAQQSGVKAAITWLAANATSLDAIQAYGDSAITKLVAKAVGKTLGATTPQDIATVQAWAKKLLAEWDDLSAKLKAASKDLEGTLGFNVSLEYSRVSEATAVLDFELDPSNAAAVAAVRAQLPGGSIRAMLAALDAIGESGDGPLPFALHDSVIVSRHVRTSAATVLLSLLGLQNLQKVTGVRTQESTVHVTDSGRAATFSGGFVQAVNAGAATSQCGAWISIDATAPALNVAQPYASATPSMRLIFSRHDPSTSAEELRALETLLEDLGFLETAAASLSAPVGAETTFTLDLGLDEAAMKLFATNDGEENWNEDYRNAAYRLIRDRMVTDRLASVGAPLGEVIASIIATDDFGATWTDTSTTRFIGVARTKSFAVGGKALKIVDGSVIVPPYLPIRTIISRRPRGLKALASLRAALDTSAMSQRNLETITGAAAATFASTAIPEWNNPMFNFWLVVARLVRQAASGNDVLKNATGLATFRFRTAPTAALSAPMQWTLTNEVGVSVSAIRARGLFPFS